MGSHRLDRVRNLLRQATSQIVARIKDPRVGFVTVTDTEVSPDLRHARIFVSILGSPEERQETLQALQRSRGFMRRELHHEISLRYIPEVSFFLDESLDRGMHINSLLRQALPEQVGEPDSPADSQATADSEHL
jgi:ribosome-binding factor A